MNEFQKLFNVSFIHVQWLLMGEGHGGKKGVVGGVLREGDFVENWAKIAYFMPRIAGKIFLHCVKIFVLFFVFQYSLFTTPKN